MKRIVISAMLFLGFSLFPSMETMLTLGGETHTAYAENKAPDFLFYEKEWLFIRDPGNKEKVIPLPHDPNRIAVFLTNNESPNSIKKLPEIAGREFIRVIPKAHDSSVGETWYIFRTSHPVPDNTYFALLEMIRRDEDVRGVSPIVTYKGKPSLILPRAALYFKDLYRPDEDYDFKTFLGRRAPMFNYNWRSKGEKHFMIYANETMAQPYLKALDLLAQEGSIASVTPEIIPIEIPISSTRELMDCMTKRPYAEIFSTYIGKKFCYRITIDYDESRVAVKTDPEEFKEIQRLPFNRPDAKESPLTIVENSTLDKKDLGKSKTRITVTYEITYGDVGDYELAWLTPSYQEKGIASAGELRLFTYPIPVKILSQIHKDMDDIISLDDEDESDETAATPAPDTPKTPLVIEGQKLEKPFEVQTYESAYQKTMATAKWAYLHPKPSIFYGIALIFLGMGTIIFFMWLGNPLLVASAYITKKAATETVDWIRVGRSRYELRSLIRLGPQSRDDMKVAVRKILKRMSDGRLEKSHTDEAIVSLIQQYEDVAAKFAESTIDTSLSETVKAIFDRNTPEDDFKEHCTKFLGLVKKNKSLLQARI